MPALRGSGDAGLAPAFPDQQPQDVNINGVRPATCPSSAQLEMQQCSGHDCKQLAHTRRAAHQAAHPECSRHQASLLQQWLRARAALLQAVPAML